MRKKESSEKERVGRGADVEDNKPAGEMPAVEVPEAVQEEARRIVSGAFRLFAGHTQRMTDDLAEFNQKRRKVTESISSGARRTSGRIV